jgi:hypothetical protein
MISEASKIHCSLISIRSGHSQVQLGNGDGNAERNVHSTIIRLELYSGRRRFPHLF